MLSNNPSASLSRSGCSVRQADLIWIEGKHATTDTSAEKALGNRVQWWSHSRRITHPHPRSHEFMVRVARVAEMITACSLSGFCCPGREHTLLFAPLLDLDDRAIPQHGSFATRPQHRAIPQHGALDEPQPRLLTHPAWGGVVHVARQEGRTADLLLSTSRTLFHLESPPSACGRASCPFWPAAAAVAPKPVSSLFLPAWPPPRRGVEPRTTPPWTPRRGRLQGPTLASPPVTSLDEPVLPSCGNRAQQGTEGRPD
jgi:hypothetical protein